ncbi:MAG: hypothetical protein GYB65_19940 [Chloroflexi bacterium]|nr:hypothetical protein [Chloroflexota bacterium]
MTKTKLHGGVIISYEQHSHAVMELLTYRLRNRVALTHYPHPNSIELHRNHHFIIVLSIDDLVDVVKFYQTLEHTPPLLVHIDTPDVVQQIDYAAEFPEVDIVALEQARLTDKDVTLKISLFREIIEHLETRV